MLYIIHLYNIATTACPAPPLALKWRKTDPALHLHGLFGFSSSNGYLALVNPSHAINKTDSAPEDLISVQLEEDPLLDFDFANGDVIYALNKKKVRKNTYDEHYLAIFIIPLHFMEIIHSSLFEKIHPTNILVIIIV